MPDRNSPGSRWFLSAELIAGVAGLVGVISQPSPSVREALTEAGVSWAVVVWSMSFLVAGFGAAFSRWRGWYYAETVAVDVLGGVFVLWAAMVAVAANTTSVQAGLGFVVAALFMHGWAVWRRYRLNSTVKSFRIIATEIARREVEQEAKTEGEA